MLKHLPGLHNQKAHNATHKLLSTDMDKYLKTGNGIQFLAGLKAIPGASISRNNHISKIDYFGSSLPNMQMQIGVAWDRETNEPRVLQLDLVNPIKTAAMPPKTSKKLASEIKLIETLAKQAGFQAVMGTMLPHLAAALNYNIVWHNKEQMSGYMFAATTAAAGMLEKKYQIKGLKNSEVTQVLNNLNQLADSYDGQLPARELVQNYPHPLYPEIPLFAEWFDLNPFTNVFHLTKTL